jgi:surfeit locus 1 family protein
MDNGGDHRSLPRFREFGRFAPTLSPRSAYCRPLPPIYSHPGIDMDKLIAGRRFRPSLQLTIAAAAVFALTVSAGNWQRHRAQEKTELGRQLQAAERAPRRNVPSVVVPAADVQHRSVEVRGRFVPELGFFLDNKVLRGTPGYQLVMPFNIAGGNVHVLVNRGWIAWNDRTRVPAVPTSLQEQSIQGRAVVPSSRFVELGPVERSGPLRQNLVLEREQRRTGLALQPWIIEQTSDAPDGLARVWERPDMGVERHIGYAVQWYVFATLTVIFYVALGFRRNEPR